MEKIYEQGFQNAWDSQRVSIIKLSIRCILIKELLSGMSF